MKEREITKWTYWQSCNLYFKDLEDVKTVSENKIKYSKHKQITVVYLNFRFLKTIKKLKIILIYKNLLKN